MSKFKLGIIGAGGIVETNHLPAISVAGQAEISWIYDKNPARAILVAKMYGLTLLEEGRFEAALPDTDICLLATPYGVRKPYIDACRNAGTALVVEKPFAFSRQEHLGYCTGFEEWKIAVNLQRRFYRSVAALHRIVRTAVFGRLIVVKFTQGHFTLKGGSGYLSDIRLAGGGVIAESAIHSLDIILWITGAQDVSVTAMNSLHANRLDYDSAFDSQILTGAGAVTVSCEISTLRNLDNSLRLQFEQATVSCDLSPDGTIFVKKGHGDKEEFILLPIPQSEDLVLTAGRINEAFLVFWQQFLAGMDSRSANRTSAYASLLTTTWIEQIYKSMNLA